MEGVERTDVVVLQREEIAQRNPYAMKVDRGRNCYACRGFGHMARHCRNRGGRVRIGDERRLEYGQRGREGSNEYRDNLKEEENLESLD